MHCYSILLKDRDGLLESKEGITYVKVTTEETMTPFLMTWFTEQD